MFLLGNGEYLPLCYVFQHESGRHRCSLRSALKFRVFVETSG